MCIANGQDHIMRPLTDDALNRNRKFSQCHEEGVDRENAVESKGSRNCNVSSLMGSSNSFALLTLELVLNAPEDLRCPSTSFEYSDKFIIGQ